MTRKTRLAWPLVLALVLAPGAAMHLRLVKSSPNDREVVTAPTREIRLWFSQKPDINLSTITLLRPDSSTVTLSKVSATDDTLSVKAALSAPLPAGSYIVRWRALSKDGHAVRGSYTFEQSK
jgi:methionine-rich copper-binding protein CopC